MRFDSNGSRTYSERVVSDISSTSREREKRRAKYSVSERRSSSVDKREARRKKYAVSDRSSSGDEREQKRRREYGDDDDRDVGKRRRVFGDIDYSLNGHMKIRDRIEEFRGDEKERITMDNLSRTLLPEFPRMKYRKVDDAIRSANHWGQRKLLLSEIEFLTLYGEEDMLVVYAGAAPGTHTVYLSDLFPELTFLLYDPADFYCKSTDRIEVVQDFFTDETIAEILSRGQRTVFISDIRTADHKKMSNSEVEKCVMEDQQRQMSWTIALNPAASMLKYRLPWRAGETEYIEGEVFLPVWGRQTTTECRLISTSYEKKLYNNKEYEEQMFYFNMVYRMQYYEHGLDTVYQCHCYDCAAEIFILKNYLKKYHPELTEEEIFRKIEIFQDEIDRACSRHNGQKVRTVHHTIPKCERDSWFPSRHYDTENKIMIKF